MSAASKACQQLVKHVTEYMNTTAYIFAYACITLRAKAATYSNSCNR